MSFKPELSTDGGKTFHANGLATHWRAVESDQPVNYEIVDGVMSAAGVPT